ncbi:MAG TPA: phosphate-starvation-inducible PsiE family protein [Bryobacteraceae bacterium]|nr:phosphate-starvation-inducible PsiE family protein [Bryobacteraceae bacterium]
MTDRLRAQFEKSIELIEVTVYAVLALLLSATGILTLAGAVGLLWRALQTWTVSAGTFQILDQLLLVLMVVEILHTVRTSLRSHTLITEPFLVVGLIAAIRRMLVITLEATGLIKEGDWRAGGESVFRASMLELALLGGLILVFVIAIAILRRQDAVPDLGQE